jgi:hypothetical protein
MRVLRAPVEELQEASADTRDVRYIVKYALLGVYGLWSALVGVQTLRQMSGELVESVWPWAIVVAAVIAIIGVIRSRRTGRHATEITGIIMLLAVLASYALTIYVRCVVEGTWTRGPTGLLPVIVMVMPYAHLLDIARKRTRKAP